MKANSAHPSMIAPMMERLGSTVLLDPAPSSKDETTTNKLYAIDGIDVGTVLAPKEDVWQFEVTTRCAREIQFQDGEQESVAIVNREDPSVSKTVNANEARMGEKLDSKEVRERRAKELQEFDEFEVKMKVVKSEARMTPGKRRCGQNGWKHERIQTSLGASRLVSALEKAVLSRNQGPNEPRDVDGRAATLNLIRVGNSFSVFFWRMQVSRI